MAGFLHRLGTYCFERKWFIVGGWALLIGVLGILALSFMQPVSNSISIPGTEAQVALDRVDALFPEAGKGSGRIVFETPADTTSADYQAQLDQLAKDVESVKGVSGVAAPVLSTDQRIGYLQLQLDNGNGSIDSETISGVERAVDKARQNNLTVEMGGDVIDKTPSEILGIGEIAGVLIALLVLVMTLGSLVSAGMPIATAITAIAVSMAALFALGKIIDISATTPVLAVMLGLAVGIDYSLFIISKYKNYLLEGYGFKPATAKAIATAGNAVIFAAATVVIALSALTIVQIPFMSIMGLTGAATIAVAAIVAVTLIPALLGIAGPRIFGGKTRRRIEVAQKRGPRDVYAPNHATFWYKWGAAITKRPVIVMIVGLLVIGAIAWPAKDLQLGLPTDEYAARTTTEGRAYDLLTKGFGVGINSPLLVVTEGLPAVTADDEAAVRATIVQTYQQKVALETAKQQALFAQRASEVTTPEQAATLQRDIATATVEGQAQQSAALAAIDGQVKQYAPYHQLGLVASRIAQHEGVQTALPALVVADGTKGAIQITPTTAPSDQQTDDLITFLRDTTKRSELTGSNNVSLAVTGSTALQTDINHKLGSALPLYLGVVIGLSLLLLIVAFRSILIPVKATLGFLLSVLAMFGALVLVFQWGWFGIAEAPGPIVSFIPIIAIGILFGLAMDYEFFLVSSMHESYQRSRDARTAVVDGFGLGAKVVTAAGVIMVAVFAGFIFNHDATIQAIGFGLAIGILVDAFIVRMTIVPAVMTLLGRSAWWLPKWLDRIVPHVSIEGEESPKKDERS